MNVLEELVAAARERVVRRRELVPESELAAAGAHRASSGDRRDFAAALRILGEPAGGAEKGIACGGGRGRMPRRKVAVIAEHKRASPSAGAIREDAPLPEVVGAYERGGAAAVSVLTEETRFGGRLEDLAEARRACSLPLLRKDFIVDGYQVHEALAAGADAILLIVAALEPGELHELHELASALGLDVLVEVHDARELPIAIEAGAAVIGINNRNLATLEVDLETTFRLLPSIPQELLVVAESGFSEPAELARLADAGVDAVLVGETLMRSPEIEAACRALSGAPPRAA
jgi:indole-3-glycerol phosphate synthase